jgi:hypothetical protein
MEQIRFVDAINRLKGTYLEIPGTKLTVDEAARLCGIEEEKCGIVLDALKEAGFLVARPARADG